MTKYKCLLVDISFDAVSGHKLSSMPATLAGSNSYCPFVEPKWAEDVMIGSSIVPQWLKSPCIVSRSLRTVCTWLDAGVAQKKKKVGAKSTGQMLTPPTCHCMCAYSQRLPQACVFACMRRGLCACRGSQ